ncbi:hypothetical protein ANN_13400 [Periplaneta americana]|uniref:Nose resistant-to-fluoxetine protein N-terminal domain-containing protein n=1 Tax=Periplaneta americana TaxID=6978 RepID=A0ABQ8TLI3_PERAM|nr:hypothetical protein ANN_13400 [Periplaneta americana]
MAKEAFNRNRSIFCGPLEKELRKRLVKCFVWSAALYGPETWTLRGNEKKRIEAFEIKDDAEADQKDEKELAGSLVEKKLPSEGYTGRNGEREKSSVQKKISDVFDSNARLPAGLLVGNLVSFGNYDECVDVVDIHTDTAQFSGKYCLVTLTWINDTRCDEQETLPHVLGFCHHGELLRMNRHNTVRSLIAASIPQNASYEVYEEVGCISSDGSTRRADIIITDRQKDKGAILDPTIRFEMHEKQPQEPGSPRTLSLRWGFCIPSTCGVQDLVPGLQEHFDQDVVVTLKVMDCHTKDEKIYTSLDCVAITVLSAFGIVVVLSTGYDIMNKGKVQLITSLYRAHLGQKAMVDITARLEKPTYYGRNDHDFKIKCRKQKTDVGARRELLLSFSLRRHGAKLLSADTSSDSLPALHGVRSLSMFWIVLGHQYQINTGGPVINKVFITSYLRSWERMPLVNFLMAVDTFLLLSGLLVAYVFLKQMRKPDARFNIPLHYLHRYIRLTPVIAVLLLIQLSLMDHLGSGPLWSGNEFITDTCRENWWAMLLYIQNYYYGEQMNEMTLFTIASHCNIHLSVVCSQPQQPQHCWARNTSWTKSGYINLGSFTKAAVSHEQSVGHIKASYLIASFGRVRVDMQLSDQLKNEITFHNKKVDQNRELLKRFIHAVCFLSKQELAFRGHDESSTSINRGNYVELLKYTAEYDPLLKAHLETSTVFKGVSNRIQNDLIEAVAKSLLEEIKLEMKLANYVAVLVDETTDVSNTAQFSIVLRYVHNGQTKERFIGFQDVSENRTAPEIAELIRQYLTEFDSNDKLIAQSYDGAASMAGRINGVQALIKQTHSQALFVHCYAHCLNLVLSNTVNNIKECKIFFSTLSGIAAFFSRSPKRTKFLDAFLQRRLPSVAPTRWNYTKRLVNTVYVHRNDLYKMFDAMLNNSSEIEKDILAPVKGYLLNLRDFTFCFLLRTFDKIFAFTSVLYSILQSKSFDITFCRKKVDETRRNISAMRNEFETVFAETADEVGEPCKRNVNYKQIYYEIFDNVDSHL